MLRKTETGDGANTGMKGEHVIDTLESLQITAEIVQLKSRYARALEERDWDLYADCLADDVDARFSPPPGQTEAVQHRGRQHLREWIPTALARTHVVMRVSSPDIEVIDADHARGTWAIVERLSMLDGDERERIYYAHYHDDYERCEDGHWRMSRIRIVRARYDRIYRDGTLTVHLDHIDQPELA